jgi:hypothetical protein
MSLNHDGSGSFIARSARLVNDDVVEVVLNVVKTVGLGKGSTVVADSFGVAGAVGDGAKLLKVMEHGSGFQMRQNGHDRCPPYDDF